MRLFGKFDSPLAAALIVATLVLFREPLQGLLDTVQGILRRYHLDLVQALLMLVVVFAIQQYRRREAVREDFINAAEDAQQARLRSQDLERHVGLSRAVAMATDFTGLHHAFSRYLPQFTGARSR